jgi:hypothetical protein
MIDPRSTLMRLALGAVAIVATLGVFAASGAELSDVPGLASLPSTQQEHDPPGDDVNGDDQNGDDTNGDDQNGDDTNGDDQNGDDANGDDQNGDDTNGDDLNGDDTNGDDLNGDDENGDDSGISGVPEDSPACENNGCAIVETPDGVSKNLPLPAVEGITRAKEQREQAQQNGDGNGQGQPSGDDTNGQAAPGGLGGPPEGITTGPPEGVAGAPPEGAEAGPPSDAGRPDGAGPPTNGGGGLQPEPE